MVEQKAVTYITQRNVCCAAKAWEALVKTAVLFLPGYLDTGLLLYLTYTQEDL